MNKEAIELLINEHQYISDIEPFKLGGIPYPAIIDKLIPGCGITHYAIRWFLSNLIIILPNVPVIMAKVAKQNEEFPEDEVLGVYKGISVDQIRAYLLKPVKYKKILATPEGFTYKIMKLFKDDLDALYSNFFLLYDECDRIVSDVDYRGDVAAPLTPLFKFKRKALVSATTLPFSDSRFNNFDYYQVKATYDFSKLLTVIHTNNVIESLKRKMEYLNSDRYCIFFNSTQGINAVIQALGIAKESKVFCAEDSIVKLHEKKFFDAYSYFEANDMVKYNFFTSRYFSAFDITIDNKPEVIMVTDVVFASHSILDPHTEAIQISGRLRNGVNSLTHITNTNSFLDCKTEDEARYYLDGALFSYNGFVASYHKATNPGSIDASKKAIEESFGHPFYADGELNSFMVDNYINQFRIRDYYRDFDNLKAAYEKEHLHFELTFETEEYSLGDNELKLLNSRQTKAEKMQTVAVFFDKWIGYKPGSIRLPPVGLLEKFKEKYPLIHQAILVLGYDKLEATDYVESAIVKEIAEVQLLKERRMLSVKVYKVFSEHKTYSDDEILKEIQQLYDYAGIKRKAKISHIKHYFKASRTTLAGVHSHKLLYRLL